VSLDCWTSLALVPPLGVAAGYRSDQYLFRIVVFVERNHRAGLQNLCRYIKLPNEPVGACT
jgi:hypothetical protein